MTVPVLDSVMVPTISTMVPPQDKNFLCVADARGIIYDEKMFASSSATKAKRPTASDEVSITFLFF